MNQRASGLAGLLAAIRHHARIVVICAVAGLALGVGYAFVRPPQVVAESSVLLPASSVGANGQPTRDMKTQSEIATSDDVLTGAAGSLHPSSTPQSIARRIKVHAASEDVLVIAAS